MRKKLLAFKVSSLEVRMKKLIKMQWSDDVYIVDIFNGIFIERKFLNEEEYKKLLEECGDARQLQLKNYLLIDFMSLKTINL